MYIGLRRNNNGAFEWLDDTPFGIGFYSNWNGNEPNNVGGLEFCAEMYDAGNWNDFACDSPRLSMCEKPACPALTTAASTTESAATFTTPEPCVCENGWTLYQQSCYRFGDAVSKNDAAVAGCESRGSHLVSIELALASRSATGCQDDSCQMFMGLHRTGSGKTDFAWPDATPFGTGFYANWNGGEPNNNGNEQCTEMFDSSLWNDMPCDFERTHMCEKPCAGSTPPPPTTQVPTTTTTPTTPVPTSTVTFFACQSGWSSHKKSCYKLLGFGPAAQDIHRTNCALQGGQLVSIADDAENTFVNQLVLTKRASIGCSTGAHCQAWLGLMRSSLGLFITWIDGSGFAGFYSNWRAEEPSNSGGSESCVEMLDSGKWNDLSCSTASRLAVCEKAATIGHTG